METNKNLTLFLYKRKTHRVDEETYIALNVKLLTCLFEPKKKRRQMKEGWRQWESEEICIHGKIPRIQ